MSWGWPTPPLVWFESGAVEGDGVFLLAPPLLLLAVGLGPRLLLPVQLGEWLGQLPRPEAGQAAAAVESGPSAEALAGHVPYPDRSGSLGILLPLKSSCLSPSPFLSSGSIGHPSLFLSLVQSPLPAFELSCALALFCFSSWLSPPELGFQSCSAPQVLTAMSCSLCILWGEGAHPLLFEGFLSGLSLTLAWPL